VTGALILTHVRKSNPAADDSTWAAVCAAALEAVIARRTDGLTLSADNEAEIVRAALQDGAAAYLERDAPHGIAAMGPDGDVVRYGRSITRALEPVLFHLSPGIG